MKKFSFFLSAAALMFAGAFTSCSNEDNATGNGTTEPPTAEVEVEVFKADFTYDFAAAAAAGENPANFNGNANKGQEFFVWWSDDANDRNTNQYKGYAWAEGSVLPEECHVWLSNDRINNNVKDGGLVFPNNRPFVVDGLDEGSIVKITYTSEQPMLWNTSFNAEHSATATINGVEAVSRETEVPSEALIEVKTIAPEKTTLKGYISVWGFKGTVITKVEIGKVVKEKKTVTI